jgi:hypothetical protein
MDLELVGQAGKSTLVLTPAVDQECPFELLDQGMERGARVIGGSLENEAGRLPADPSTQLVDDTRLANPGFPREEDRLTLPAAREPPSLFQGLELPARGRRAV